MTRPILGALAPALLAAFACAAHAQWWNPMDGRSPSLRMLSPVQYDSGTYHQARQAANGFLFSEKFAEVERMYDEFMQQKARSTDGRFMVQALQDVVAESIGNMDERMARNLFRDWEAKVPQSRLRPLLHAVMLQAQAWKARGTSSGSSEEGRQIFRERLQLAAKALADNEQAGKESPIWWWVALIVAGSSGASPAQMDALFEEAVARFPSYQPLYYTRVNYLLPQWGGSPEAVGRFVNASAARTASIEGRSMYAWLYVDMAQKRCCGPEGGMESWPKLKEAFDDLVKRYPDALNKNLYASYACRARDRETTGRLLTELGDKAQLWSPGGITTEGCRRFAFTGT